MSLRGAERDADKSMEPNEASKTRGKRGVVGSRDVVSIRMQCWGEAVFMVCLRILQVLSDMPIFSIVKHHSKARINQSRIQRSRQGNTLTSSEKWLETGLGK